ncbi:MAG TPA: hypothetical protein VG944_12330 [Fimbriimonas sp.]|nr:hypothetical protein [Fimbriimonas sp.]
MLLASALAFTLTTARVEPIQVLIRAKVYTLAPKQSLEISGTSNAATRVAVEDAKKADETVEKVCSEGAKLLTSPIVRTLVDNKAEITFEKEVDHKQVTTKLSILPKVAGDAGPNPSAFRVIVGWDSGDAATVKESKPDPKKQISFFVGPNSKAEILLTLNGVRCLVVLSAIKPD